MLKEDKTLEFKELIKSNILTSFPPKRSRLIQPKPPIDTWTKQAEQVATNLRSFSTFLSSIRRAYLDLGSTSSSSSVLRNNQPIDPSKGLLAYEGVRWLSDRDRDEIDFGVKVALRKSVDRVRELESAEKARLAYMAKIKPTVNPLTRFLTQPSSSRPIPPITDPLASHRSCITHYLNSLLAKVSQIQRIQQETRVQRQLDKNSSLGEGSSSAGMVEFAKKQADKDKIKHSLMSGIYSKEKSNLTNGNSTKIGEVPSIYRPSPSTNTLESDPIFEDLHASTSHLSSTLTPSQIQQFEAEESILLSSTQADLASLKLAESSLLEISSLQSQLAIHLASQSELTDQLWEEAVGVTGKVEEGNVQLRKARERNRESRVWLLIFLMGASGTLLFLDYYT